MDQPFIFHIAKKSEWQSSETQYVPPSFESEGFIHCSAANQILKSAEKHFKNAEELLLLKLDAKKLKSKVKYEGSGGEKFPHIYGPINRDAVFAKSAFRSYLGLGFVLPAMAGESVFSKVIRGDFPSYKVFENDFVFCILTRDAIRLGHTLVIPKVEVDHFANVPDPYYSEIFRVGRELSQAIQKATGCLRVGAVIAGFEVPHCHLHLIPTDGMEDFDFKKGKVWSASENQQMLEKIRISLLSFSGKFGV